ncbi:hypothetical protein K438DRAFT_1757230 [Mycena galopus ATCC 62051]|nr:hypothetical protein K438DRAFT_1757230 [Mycena galopus ATCC 62051]
MDSGGQEIEKRTKENADQRVGRRGNLLRRSNVGLRAMSGSGMVPIQHSLRDLITSGKHLQWTLEDKKSRQNQREIADQRVGRRGNFTPTLQCRVARHGRFRKQYKKTEDIPGDSTTQPERPHHQRQGRARRQWREVGGKKTSPSHYRTNQGYIVEAFSISGIATGSLASAGVTLGYKPGCKPLPNPVVTAKPQFSRRRPVKISVGI